MRNNLYFKFGLVIILGIIGVMTIQIFAMYGLRYHSYKMKLIETTDQTIDRLAKSVGDFLIVYGLQDYKIAIEREMVNPDFLAIIVDDRRMAYSIEADSYITGKIRDSDRRVVDFKESEPAHLRALKNHVYIASRTIEDDSEYLGNIEIYASNRLLKKSLSDFLTTAVLQTFIVGFVLFVVLMVCIKRFLIQPINSLTELVRGVEAGDFTKTTGVKANDEIGRLAASFNRMTIQLNHTLVDLKEEIGLRKRFTEILECTSDIVSIATWDSQITYINFAGRKTLGWFSENDAVSKKIQDLHPKWALEIIEQIGVPTAVANGVWKGETAVFDEKGNEIPVSQVIMSHKSSSGVVDYLSTIMHDISDRITIEKRVRYYRNFLESIIDSMPSALIGVDPEGKITQWNREAEKLTGLTMQNTHNGYLYQALPQLAGKMEIIYKAVQTRMPLRENHFPFKRGDSVSYLDIVVYPLITDELEGAVIRLDDVTERIRIEEELRIHQNHLEDLVRERTIDLEAANAALKKAKEKADSASSAKSEFLANMSHEIRTPMNAILGFSEILYGKETDPQKVNYLDSILASGKSLLNLINDILDLSKIEAGKLDLHYTAVSPRRLFIEMKTLFGRSIVEKGLDLIIEIPDELPEILLLDETRLRQILINLIGNAVKFTKSGYIKISVRHVYAEKGYKSSLDLLFAVEDTGSGIPEDKKEDIFAAFEQLKDGKARQFEGAGLGLTISRRLIEMMNGKITVESAVNQGTVFNIILHDVEAASANLSDSGRLKEIDYASIQFQPAVVLVADDIEYNRDLVKGYFEDYDIRFLEAETGRETIEKAGAEFPDIILLDMKMPDIDGYEAARILKGDPELKSIPLIAVTASAMKSDEEEILMICDAYLKKPVSKSDLILEVMNFLPHSRITPQNPNLQKPSLFMTEDFTGASLLQYPDLNKLLTREKGRVERLISLMAIDQIEAFAMEMRSIGEKFGYSPLVHWGEALFTAAQVFDMERITSVLSTFKTATTRYSLPEI